MKNIVSYSLVCIFIIGCSQSNSKSESNKASNIQIIDIDNGLKTISRIPIKCSDFIDSVQYINLETNQESLIGGLRGVQIMTTPDFLYGDLKKFSLTDGKYIHSVGKRGRGPGEFTMAIGSATDIINNRVFVLDNWTEELLIYDADNNFIKKIDVGDQVQSIGYLGNENLIFLRDDSFIFYPPLEYQVYNLSEERISYTREILELKEPLKDSKVNNLPGIGRNCTWYFDNNFQIYESFSDTIFSIDSNGKTVPRFYINRQNNKPSISDIKNKESFFLNRSNYLEITKISETPRFLFIYFIKFLDKNPDSYVAAFDKNKQETTIVPLIGAFENDISKIKIDGFYNLQGSNDGLGYLNSRKWIDEFLSEIETIPQSEWKISSKKLYDLLKKMEPTDNGIVCRYVFKK